jgi:hypothetical protein
MGVHYEHFYKDFPAAATTSMKCYTVKMEPGDRLYVPVGVLHQAKVLDSRGSVHLTIGLPKFGVSWADLLINVLGSTDSTHRQHGGNLGDGSISGEGSGGGGGGSAVGSSKIGTAGLWQAGGPGRPRKRTNIRPGVCEMVGGANSDDDSDSGKEMPMETSGCSRMERLVFKVLRASAVTNGACFVLLGCGLQSIVVHLDACVIDSRKTAVDNVGARVSSVFWGCRKLAST